MTVAVETGLWQLDTAASTVARLAIAASTRACACSASDRVAAPKAVRLPTSSLISRIRSACSAAMIRCADAR